MKTMKIASILFITLISLNFASCGSDDTPNDDGIQDLTSEISVDINGNNVVFDTVVIGEYEDNGTNYRSVSATIGNDTNTLMTFAIPINQTGSDLFYDFYFVQNGKSYFEINTFLNNVIITNSDKKLTGNFSGDVQYNIDGQNFETLTFSNGSIDLNY